MSAGRLITCDLCNAGEVFLACYRGVNICKECSLELHRQHRSQTRRETCQQARMKVNATERGFSGRILKPAPCTHAELLRWLDYNPQTGLFHWKHGRRAGMLAGSKMSKGYWSLRLGGRNGRAVLAHRVAWFYVTGEWPGLEVDHADLNKTNNIFTNLRLATHSQNNVNRGLMVTNTSGFKGVFFDGALWVAQIGENTNGMRRNTVLGRFDDPRRASAVYKAESLRRHGEFARAA